MSANAPSQLSTPQPTFTILYFAAASSHTSKTHEPLPAPLPLRDLFPSLEQRYPGFTEKVLSSCAVTVNLDYVDLDDVGKEGGGLVIKEGDEVGIIPPVSSG